MNQAKPWHEDDDSWEMFTPTMFPESRWAAAAEEVDCVVALTNIRLC